MRKLRLNVEELAVESFRADADRDGLTKGTVHAHQETSPFRCTMFCTYNCTGIPCFGPTRPC